MNETSQVLTYGIASVPKGRWAVGVSGGADSVALLALLRGRGDLSLHVAHLDHQTRGEQSTGDARFVEELARRWDLPCTVARREEIESALTNLPANMSARYRAVRLELFRRVVQSESLSGVILAHHALDQAETVLHRLLRGSAYAGLAGMSRRAVVGGLVIVRPLLMVEPHMLTEHLRGQGQEWRTDASNESNQYLRNRLRKLLKRHPNLGGALLELARASAALRDWSRSSAATLPERFETALLARLPSILAHESARRWLIDRGVPVAEVSTEVVERLVDMSRDAATAPRQDFPGPLRVRRRGGTISVDQG